MFGRLVQKPPTLNVAPKKQRLLLPQKDQAALLSRPRRVPSLPPSTSNAFNNPMPIVNQDRRHYTPCFILQEEHVFSFPFRYTTGITRKGCSAVITSSCSLANRAPLYFTLHHLQNELSFLNLFLCSSYPNTDARKITVRFARANTRTIYR